MPAAARVTLLLSLGLVLNQAGLMAFPAVLPVLMQEWRLSAAEAGWIGGIYFAGYAAAVPFLAGITDRIDARLVYVPASLLGAAAGFGFAFLADGFWPALALRFLAGAGLAGVHMPGLKLLADRTAGAVQSRCSAIYASAYAIGSGGSFLLAGPLAAALGWPAAFVAAGVGPLLALLALPFIGPAAAAPTAVRRLDFGAVVRDRRVMAWVACYAGNTWEVFGIRTWFVAFLAFAAAQQATPPDGPGGAVLSGLSALTGVVASIAIAEIAVRHGRRRTVLAVTLASVAACAALALWSDAAWPVVLGLLFLHGLTSYGDTGTITGGAVAAADPARRGTALAVYALGGFAFGFLGPVVVGQALQWGGGVETKTGWAAAFATIALGSAAGALVQWRSRER